MQIFCNQCIATYTISLKSLQRHPCQQFLCTWVCRPSRVYTLTIWKYLALWRAHFVTLSVCHWRFHDLAVLFFPGLFLFEHTWMHSLPELHITFVTFVFLRHNHLAGSAQCVWEGCGGVGGWVFSETSSPSACFRMVETESAL